METFIAIMGPTATGKSDLGLQLAAELDGEIVNADALQVYRGFDIGTAKPSAEMQRRVPHHLIDILDPEEAFSVGQFVDRARTAIEEIQGRGKTAILVGGTGLYLRSLIEGMSTVPPSDPEVRRELIRRTEEEGLAGLYADLERLDPATARRLPPGDTQRIQRALEVALVSGKPLSEWIAEKPGPEDHLPAFKIGLTLQRSILYDRISGRIECMVRRGWVVEVEGLLSRGIEPTVPAFQAIGYRQLVKFVRGDWPLSAALGDIAQATRRYAKRQMTWFRKERDLRWISALDRDRAISSLLNDFQK